MKGAVNITAIDIDNWAYENCQENVRMNQCKNIEVYLGEVQLLKDRFFDIILANINRNIILEDIVYYAAALKPGGQMILSGFFIQDKAIIEEKARSLDLITVSYLEKNNWIVLNLLKSD